MGEEIKRLGIDSSTLKTILLENNNIDILLYLAKYNPKVTIKEIAKNFGKESVEGLMALIKFCLVKEEGKRLSLTEEGLFQVDGLLTLVV